VGVTLKAKDPERIAEALLLGNEYRPTIRLRLSVTGEVADYALIWEWGRVTCQPGPKTMWSTNPDGQTVVMTKTAPNGFIRVNQAKYRQFVKEELKKIPWKKIKKFRQIPPEIEEALFRAASRCANLIAQSAPIDTGALREAIRMSDASEQADRLSFRLRPVA